MEGSREYDDSEEAMSRVAGYGGNNARSDALRDVRGVDVGTTMKGFQDGLGRRSMRQLGKLLADEVAIHEQRQVKAYGRARGRL